MATVRFSNNLRDSILHKAEVMFSDRIEDIRKAVVHEEVYRRVIEPVISPIAEKAKQLPEQYFMFTKEVVVYVKHPEHGNFRRDYMLPEQTIQPKRYYNIAPGIRLDSGYNHLAAHISFDALPDDIKEYTTSQCTALYTLRNQAKTFKDGVDKLIHHYATLAPALKEWPPLWDLLPSSVQVKHKEISEKRSKSSAKEELNLSLDSMTGTVVANKLAGKL